MKTILALLILFSVVVLPALGELTDADLNQIRLIVNEAEKRIKEEVKTEITNAEERINKHTNVKIDSLKTPVVWFIGILVALIALIGIPLVVLTIMMGWRSVKDSSQEKINQEFREEIEMLKQQQIVQP